MSTPDIMPARTYWNGERYVEPRDPEWSLAAFERAAGIRSFGWALDHLKDGKKVCREGWNGKGMWIVLQEGYPDGIPINANTARATGMPEGTTCKFLPYIMMRTVDGSFVPWLASQTDVLAGDWQLVE